MRILLSNPRGFCAGVNMAVESLDKALEIFGSPIYAYHEIVHNKHVVEGFRGRGVVFVEELSQVPRKSVLLFSAHGVSPQIRAYARERELMAIDATCPLVTKVHLEALKFAKEGYQILLIGHAGHDEVLGTMGEAPHCMRLIETLEDVGRLSFPPDTKLAYLTQTTLGVSDTRQIISALKERFPQIVGPKREDICYATQNRQEAVGSLASESDLVLVLGSQNSSNSQRLAEIARGYCPAHLIDGPDEIQPEWFDGVKTVAVTAGASAPERVVQGCVAYLQERYGAVVEDRIIREEKVRFGLPSELRRLAAQL